jgi:hypothetical protein
MIIHRKPRSPCPPLPPGKRDHRLRAAVERRVGQPGTAEDHARQHEPEEEKGHAGDNGAAGVLLVLAVAARVEGRADHVEPVPRKTTSGPVKGNGHKRMRLLGESTTLSGIYQGLPVLNKSWSSYNVPGPGVARSRGPIPIEHKVYDPGAEVQGLVCRRGYIGKAAPTSQR